MEHRTIVVRAEWDAEARVYVATSGDVPGLVAEAATLADLEAKVAGLVPDLLALNGDGNADRFDDVPFYLLAQHIGRTRVPKA